MKKDDEFYLYFILRSIIMGLLGAVLFALLVWALKLTDIVHLLLASVLNFFLSLFISRLFDAQTKRSVERMLRILVKYPRIRGFLLKNF